MRGADGGGGGKASGSTEGYRKDFGVIQHAGRVRRIQTLRAFRRPQLGGLEACRHRGLEDWGKGKSELANGCRTGGKLVPGRPKWVLGPPNWRRNGSRAAKIGAWRVPIPPKLDLGRPGRRFGRPGARLDGHLGGPGTHLASQTRWYGHLGGPGAHLASQARW